MSFNETITNPAINPLGQAYFSLDKDTRKNLASLVEKEFPLINQTMLEKRMYFKQKNHPSNLRQRIKDIFIEFNPEVFQPELFLHNEDVPLFLSKKALKFQEEQEKRDSQAA